MNPKKLKQLKKRVKKAHQIVNEPSYIQELNTYRDLFDDFPPVKYLINNVLESDRLLKNGLLPQPLPKLLLPDTFKMPFSKRLMNSSHKVIHVAINFGINIVRRCQN